MIIDQKCSCGSLSRNQETFIIEWLLIQRLCLIDLDFTLMILLLSFSVPMDRYIQAWNQNSVRILPLETIEKQLKECRKLGSKLLRAHSLYGIYIDL